MKDDRGWDIPEGLLCTPQGIYVLRDDSHLSRWVEWHKKLDIAEGQIEFYKRFIPAGGTVVDAGACIGDHTLTYAKLVGPSGRVLAFEPNPLAFEALKLNFERWSSVVVVNAALSDRVGQVAIVVEANAGASWITADKDGPVRCEVLDTYCDSMMSCDLIHFDLEGFEFPALRGAQKVIERFKPAIVLEINHACLARYGVKEADVVRFLDSLGYRCSELEPHLNSSYPQRDIIALPRP